jgi:fumarylacetoacetase
MRRECVGKARRPQPTKRRARAGASLVTSDTTTDPARRSWLPVPSDSDFPIQNLPYGALERSAGEVHLCVAIGEHALDLHVVAHAGLLDGTCSDARAVLGAPNLNALLAAGPLAWRAVRETVFALLAEGDMRLHEAGIAEAALPLRRGERFRLPLHVSDYVDFYSSLEHATNLGKMLRPGGEPLLPNWRHLPVGYHGRTSTIVASGTDVVRPCGQRKSGDEPPVFGPSQALDFELELGFVTGDASAEGGLPAPERAVEAIFGVALLNDWSARDMQAWEYQPLGPFLSKSFATTLGPWIVTLDALAPYRVAGPAQEPPPLPYLAQRSAQNYDIALEVTLRSEAMARSGTREHVIAQTNFSGMYWSMAQQLAHASSNGARPRAGDLYGSGTVSGAQPHAYGSLIELTWRGTRPLALPDGSARAYLADGDEVVMRGLAVGEGRARVGFGECRGTIAPARSRP